MYVMPGCRFIVSKICAWDQEPHTTKSSTVYKGLKGQTDTSRAYWDADPGLVGPTATAAAAVLLLEKLCCRCFTAISSSCGTCYEKLFLSEMPCSCCIFFVSKILCRLSGLEAGNKLKKRVPGSGYILGMCMYAYKGCKG